MSGHGLAKAAMQRLIWAKQGETNCKQDFCWAEIPLEVFNVITKSDLVS